MISDQQMTLWYHVIIIVTHCFCGLLSHRVDYTDDGGADHIGHFVLKVLVFDFEF